MAGTDKTNTRIDPIVDGSGPNGKLQEGDDWKPEIKKTLGDYLSCLTKDNFTGNEQKLKSGIEEYSITLENGDPAPMDLTARGSENPFSPSATTEGMQNISDSGKIFTPSINDYLIKGKDGHNFLKNEGEKIDAAVSTALNNNRFSAGPRTFSQGGKPPNRVAGVQDELGSYRSQGPEIFYSDLQKVGLSLMLKAAGEIPAASEGDPTSIGAGAASLIPGKTQLAIVKIDSRELEARNAFGAFEKPTLNDIDFGGNVRSWGNLNTFLEPFDGFLPIGMTILGSALVIALTLVTKGILGLLGLIVKPRADINFAPTHGPFIAGEYGRPEPPGTFISLKSIGILATDRDYLTCVNEGLRVFFGFDGTSFKRVLKSPGFYTIFVRNVIRSGNIIINDIKDVFTSNLNPISAVQDFIGIVETLKSSKIIAFLNILAQIGDRSLELKSKGFSGNGRKISIVENLETNPATRIMKHRESRSDLALSYRNSSLPSKFLFSDDALVANNILSSVGKTKIDQAAAGLGKDLAKSDEIIGNRISTETVEKVEAELDSEYVPFYFHDLRTNEIISFHAFLESLDDNYTVNYEETDAYGRVDKVYTYNNTLRNINLSFSMFATSKPDFDVMWWKINKLSTLLYTQWSEGRQVFSSEGNTLFIQPFSQIPTSTPLIRLRIGDLIKSNFSKFSLARLFGVGNPKTDESFAPTGRKNFTSAWLDRDKLVDVRNRMIKNPAFNDPEKSGYKVGEKAMLMPKLGGYMEAKDSPPSLLSSVFRTGEGKKLIVPSDIRVIIKKSASSDDKLIQQYGEHKISYYIVEVDGVDGQSDELKGEYVVMHTDLYPDNQEIAKIARGDNEEPSETVPELTFFNADENAIVRSFKSVQGKGLMCVIKSMSFIELAGPTAIWETSDYNSRAPKMIKVQMSVDVIHDITPGIDSSGFARAVQYPVGGIAAKVAGEIDDGNGGAEEKFNKNNVEAFSAFRKKGDKD